MKISVKAGLALAASAAFVTTSVAPAFAASQVDFSGFYQAKFHTYGNTGFDDQDKKSDTWFRNRFRLNMDVQATDEVSVHARWQGPNDKKWGRAGDDNVQVKYAYGQVKQDWGTIQVGKLNDQDGIGHAGLKTMGWDPLSVDGDEENYRPFDTGQGGDGINYFNAWDNGFSFEAAFLRMKSSDRLDKWTHYHDDSNTRFDYGNDREFDRYQAEARYAWDTGAASLAVMYDRDAYNNNGIAYADDNLHGYTGTPTQENGEYSTTSVWYLNPAFMQSWGAFSTHAEAMFAFGKYNGFEKASATDKRDDKISGQGFYIDFDYNYGPGRVNLAGWWTSGTEYTDTKQKSLPDGMGKGFAPLLMLYDGGALAAANTNQGGPLGGGFNYSPEFSNHWVIDLNGQHAFTDEITARWAIAYAALNKANWGEKMGLSDGGHFEDQDKDLGWEIDLGATINILDNLDFYTGFGYLFAGDAFNTTYVDANNKKNTIEGDDGYCWINTLYFNF